MAARKPRNTKDIRRTPSKRNAYDRVLIVCEGEKTEVNYFEGLIKSYKLSSANIEITSANGKNDPISIVKHGKQLYDKAERDNDNYDRVYCVFDQDEHTGFNQARQQLNSLSGKGFHPACSWPCFEYWLLLHFEYQRSPFKKGNGKTAEHCKQTLKSKYSSYSKNKQNVFIELNDKLDTAISNANRSSKDAERTEEKNPSTEVHHLIEYLHSIKT